MHLNSLENLGIYLHQAGAGWQAVNNYKSNVIKDPNSANYIVG